jgi:NAD(P)-dependent dehydrogenase (short-subunit alcohol dehydrogenase family)
MKKIIVITGATGALGGAVASELSKQENITVVLLGRNQQKLDVLKNTFQKNGSTVRTIVVDLGETDSVKRAVETLRLDFRTIDALVHVAAVYKKNRTLNKKGQELMFATNHLAPYQLTYGLLDILKATPNSRVITVTAPSSTKLNLEDLSGSQKFSALNAFGASKMANLLFAFRLAKDLGNTSTASVAFFPGLIKSGLLNEMPKIVSGIFKLVASSPEKASQKLIELILNDNKTANGKFFDKKGKELKAAPYAYESAIQEELSAISKTLVA